MKRRDDQYFLWILHGGYKVATKGELSQGKGDSGQEERAFRKRKRVGDRERERLKYRKKRRRCGQKRA